MREALEGSQAIARAVALCAPDVIAAYPITPQTHIVENHGVGAAHHSVVRHQVLVESILFIAVRIGRPSARR